MPRQGGGGSATAASSDSVVPPTERGELMVPAEMIESLLSQMMTKLIPDLMSKVVERFEDCFTNMMAKLDSVFNSRFVNFEAKFDMVLGDINDLRDKVNKLDGDISRQMVLLNSNANIAQYSQVVQRAQADATFPTLFDTNATTVRRIPVSTSRVNQQKPGQAVNSITGKRAHSQTVKAVKKPLTCFVGRLDQTTTENDLKQYLEDVGIKDARCAKLQAKDGRVFTTAAFRVSCRDEFRELFYNEDSWPEGAELRDWYFGTRNAAA